MVETAAKVVEKKLGMTITLKLFFSQFECKGAGEDWHTMTGRGC